MTQDQIGLIASIIATVAALVALRFDMFSHAHGREEAFRRVGGWTIAVLGAGLTGVGIFVWLGAAGLPPARKPDVTAVVAGSVGLALMVLGAVRVARTPAEPDVSDLRHIVKTLGARLDRLDGLQVLRRWTVDPVVTVGGRFPRRRPVSRVVPRRNAKVTFLVGEAGAGKSVALRELARAKTGRVMRTKRPREVALYIDLGPLADEELPATAETVRGHVHRAVSGGDSVIEANLRRLMDGHRRLKWIFLFDGIDDTAVGQPTDRTEKTSACLDAIRQFLDSRPAFCGVVAVRDEPKPEQGDDVRRLAPFTPARQREMAARRGIPADAVNRLRTHLAGHPELAQAATSPMVMGLLLDHVERSGVENLPGSTYELVEVSASERLQPVRGSLTAAEIDRAAEQLAARSTDPELDAVDSPQATEALIAAGIVRSRQADAVVFGSRLFQDYYAARWLMSQPHRLDPRRLLMTAAWREPVAICLRRGTDELRELLVTVARDVLEEQLAEAGWAVDAVAPYLTPSADGSTSATSAVAMSWPVSMTGVLELLGTASRDGFGPTACPQLTPIVDRIVVSAFVRGDKQAQQHALSLVPITSPEVGAWAVTRLGLAEASSDLTFEVAKRMDASPEVFLRLPGPVRLVLLLSTLLSASMVNHFLLLASASRTGRPESLARLVRAAVRLMQVMAIMSIGRAVTSLVKISNGDTSLADPWFYGLVIVGCGLFLAGSQAMHQRPISPIVYATVAFPVLLTLVMLIAALDLALRATVAFLGGSLSDAAVHALGAAANSWPVALVLYMGWSGRLPEEPRDWLLPHVLPARALFARYFERRNLAEIVGNIVRSVNQTAVLRLASAAIWGTLGIVVVGRGIDVPFVAPADQDGVRGWVCVGLIVLAFQMDKLLVRRGKRITRQHTVQRLGSGHLTAEEFLQLFQQAGGLDFPGKKRQGKVWEMPETDFLLRALGNSPVRSLEHAMPAIRDLEAALRHIGWLVSKESYDPIAGGVWDIAPAFSHPGFLQWVIAYDERFPGQLVRLAAARHDQIKRLVDTATST